jgi:hypothetical protein
MNRQHAMLAIVCAGVLGIATVGQARAQTVYTIKVDIDQSANGELGVVKAVLGTADVGDASPALRGIAAKLTTEFQVGLSDRISDLDVLKLDDGSEVLLVEGDEIKVISKKCLNFPCAGATIIWDKGHTRPLAIFITNAYGECVKGIRWNVLKGSRRPDVTETCSFGPTK